MKKILLFVPLVCAFSVMFSAGCSEKPEEIKSVQWYKAPENKQALDDKLAWCRQHKEKQGVDQNCINAETASTLGGSFKKVIEPAIPDFTAPAKK